MPWKASSVMEERLRLGGSIGLIVPECELQIRTIVSTV